MRDPGGLLIQDLSSTTGLAALSQAGWLAQVFVPIPNKGGSNGSGCENVQPSQLDYSTPRFYRSEGRTVSPRSHIEDGHVYPPRLKTDENENTFYVSGINLRLPASWREISNFNAITFQTGGAATNRKTKSLEFVKTFPQVNLPNGLTWLGLGWDFKSGLTLRTNKLVVERNCKSVITSFPKQ